MQFATLAAFASLAATALAEDGVFAITGNAIANQYVYLQVLNGVISAPPTCNGSANIGGLPASGSIPCNAPGYGLTFSWASDAGAGIQATYMNPSVTFTYNVPLLGCTDNKCEFGFTNIFHS